MKFQFQLGDRVQVKRTIDRYPDFVVHIGAYGTVTTISETEGFGVTFDKPIAGCEQWDNEVQWYTQHPEFNMGDPVDDLVLIERPEVGRMLLGDQHA